MESKIVKLNKRDSRIDLIKVIAIIFVIATHSYTNAGYFNIPLRGEKLFFISIFRNILNTCVPLFFVTSGYLLSNTSLTDKKYRRVIYLLYQFVVITLLIFLGEYIFLDKTHDVLNIVIHILKTNDFIQMYIFLFLLSPFLNILYKGISKKKDKQILILILLGLSSLPSLLNVDFQNPVFTTRWISLYPILYYYLGVYLKEQQPFLKARTLILMLLSSVLIQTLILFYRAPHYEGTIFRYFSGNYESIFVVISTICIFLLILKVKIKSLKIKTVLKVISNLTFSIFLVSTFVDRVLCNYFDVQHNFIVDFPKMLLIVPISFLVSTLFSLIIEKINNLLMIKKP